VVSDSTDANLLDLNPRWAWEVPDANPFPVPRYDGADIEHMTSQPTSFDSGPTRTALVIATCPGRHGHRNWRDVTYTGTLEWIEHAGGLTKDDDYNVFIRPAFVDRIPFAAGGMADRPDRINMEFDSDETVDHFGDGQPTFWTTFHDAVDSNNEFAKSLINGKYAIAVGLLNIDEVHDDLRQTGNELHPVHALAIRLTSQKGPLYLEEHWAVFVRNWGNEGFCGKHQHYLNTNDITLRLEPSDPGIVDAGQTVPADAAENLFTNASASGYWRVPPSLPGTVAPPAWASRSTSWTRRRSLEISRFRSGIG
jgi:hypothetical protein